LNLKYVLFDGFILILVLIRINIIFIYSTFLLFFNYIINDILVQSTIRIILFCLFQIYAPDGRRPRRAEKAQTITICIAPNGPYLRGLGEHGRAQIWPKWSERRRAERGPSPHRIPRGEARAGCYMQLRASLIV